MDRPGRAHRYFAGMRCQQVALAFAVLGALVSAVMRENAVLAPRGHTRLAAGDLIYVLAPPEDATRVAAVVNGPRPESPGTGAATLPPSAPPLPAGPGSDRG